MSSTEADIRIRVGFFRHFKTRKLKRLLGAEAVLCLQTLWGWAAENRQTGDLCGMADDDISISADWDGDTDAFISGLVSCGWLDGIQNEYQLHDYEHEQPYIQKRAQKIENAKRGAEKANANMTPEQRSERARNAANIRWMLSECSVDAQSSEHECSVDAKSMLAPNLTLPILTLPNQTDPVLALPNSVPVLPSTNVLCPDKTEHQDRISNTTCSHSKAGGLSSDDDVEKKEFTLFGEPFVYGQTDMVPDNPSEQPATETHRRTKTQKEAPRSDLDPLRDKSIKAVAKVSKKGKSGPSTAKSDDNPEAKAEPKSKKRKRLPCRPHGEEADEMFRYWQMVMNAPLTRISTDRVDVIEWAIDAYGFDRCKIAINGCASCPHNMGQNQNRMVYNDVTLIFRDEKNFERFEQHGKKAKMVLDSNTGVVSVKVEGGKREETHEERIVRLVAGVKNSSPLRSFENGR